MGLDLERHGPVVADVHHARVLADAHHEVLLHGLGGLLAELLEVHLGRLVGAVLRPHHGVHRELRGRGAAAEEVEDLAYSSALRPSAAHGCSCSGVAAAISTVSRWLVVTSGMNSLKMFGATDTQQAYRRRVEALAPARRRGGHASKAAQSGVPALWLRTTSRRDSRHAPTPRPGSAACRLPRWCGAELRGHEGAQCPHK